MGSPASTLRAPTQQRSGAVEFYRGHPQIVYGWFAEVGCRHRTTQRHADDMQIQTPRRQSETDRTDRMGSVNHAGLGGHDHAATRTDRRAGRPPRRFFLGHRTTPRRTTRDAPTRDGRTTTRRLVRRRRGSIKSDELLPQHSYYHYQYEIDTNEQRRIKWNLFQYARGGRTGRWSG